MTKSLFDAFRDVMMSKPDASRKEAMDDFILKMRSQPDYLEMLARDYFERMAQVWTVRSETLGGHSFGRTEVSRDKVLRMSHPRPASNTQELVRRTRAESEARTSAVLTNLKDRVRAIVLLDLALPNGKALRNATGAECAKAGGFYAEVAKHLKPAQVVDRHMSEGDLQNIRARFFQANKKEAVA